MIRCLPLRLAGVLLALATATVAGAQWPDRPVRVIVPYVSGAMGDTVSRLLAEELRVKLGQSVIVDNRPGANTIVAYEATTSAPRPTATRCWCPPSAPS